MQAVDLGFFQDFFEQYVHAFHSDDDYTNLNIALKKEHSLKVSGLCGEIAMDLGLNDEEILLARTAGLLHDIGRFPQFMQYRTYVDSISINHALLGVGILHEKGVLNRLPSKERQIVLTAIVLHNKHRIPTHLCERIDRQVRVLRDADKLDIYRVVAHYYENSANQPNAAVEDAMPDTPGYNPRILQDLMEGKNSNSSEVKNLNDTRLLKCSWVFDMNFPITKHLLKKRGYLEAIFNMLPDNQEIQQVRAHLFEHLQ
jgi:putative nucleotidyltransferase with HDIG domain